MNDDVIEIDDETHAVIEARLQQEYEEELQAVLAAGLFEDSEVPLRLEDKYVGVLTTEERAISTLNSQYSDAHNSIVNENSVNGKYVGDPDKEDELARLVHELKYKIYLTEQHFHESLENRFSIRGDMLYVRKYFQVAKRQSTIKIVTLNSAEEIEDLLKMFR